MDDERELKERELEEKIKKLRREHCQKRCSPPEICHCGVCAVADEILRLKFQIS